MPKNLGLYNDNLSIPRKQDINNVQDQIDILSNVKLTTPEGLQGQILGYVDNNIVGALEAPSGAFSYSGILTSTWISSGQQYYQQFSIPEITSDEVPLVIPQWSSNKANEQKVWNDLEIQSFNGYVRIYATKKSSVNINFILICNKTS